MTQRITRDFGRELLASHDDVTLERGQTAAGLLEAYEDAEIREGDAHATAIDGLRLRLNLPRGWAWVVNVNGIETDSVLAEHRLRPGDVVQWDYHSWHELLDVRATVGAFPETFTRGDRGRRFPVVVDCAGAPAAACARVERTLRDAGVATDGAAPPGPRGEIRRARVVVGPWSEIGDRPRPHRIDKGPRYSGVFARFAPSGDELRLLDPRTRRARTVGAGAGLIAAMRPTEESLLWVVTGVDAVGVERAARALGSEDLSDAFAVAVTADGVEKLPLPPSAH